MRTFSKLGATTSILSVREGQKGSLVDGLGSDWTEARVGMYFTGVDSIEDDVSCRSETRTGSDYSDYLTFGLKNSDNFNLPGESSSSFIGVRSNSITMKAVVPSGTPGWFADLNQECIAMGYAGATIVNGGVLANSSLRFPDPSPATGFNGFYCVKLVVSGRGTASQAVSISISSSPSISGTDYGKAALYQIMNNATFGPAKIVVWNTGVAARTLPNAAWVRLPFFGGRIRIQEIMAIKVQP